MPDPILDLQSLADIANREHTCGEESAHKSLSHFRAAGDALIEAKKQVGHGKFKAWVEANVSFSYRTARDYMRLAEHGGENGSTAASLRDALDLIANGDNSRLMKAERREAKRRANDEARRRMAEAAKPCDLVRVGDFRNVLADLPDESVDLIFTDPPYLTADLPIYGDLGLLAARVLKPGGSLVCYSPTYNLLAATDQVRPHLDFWTALVIQHTGPASKLFHFRIIAQCKILLWFVKGRYEVEWLESLILGTRPDKSVHDWAQGEGEASYFIKKMTPPGGMVLDPCCGSGTTLRAALFLGRRTLGCEIDPDRAKVAAVRCDLRAEAANPNAPGWTCWQRVVWLGLLNAEQKAEPSPVTSCVTNW